MRSNVTGAGFYNSEPRNFNRFGRGNSRPHQSSQPPPSPQPPPRRGDLFIEAGQLAVEYLVSHGLLSSNALPGKCQNGSLRSFNGEPQDNRSSQDRELLNSLEPRSNASARPRAASPDLLSSSQRSPSDQDSSRKYSRERRKYGASRSYSSDWTRENEREVSLVEKVAPSQAMEVDFEKHPKDGINENSDVSIAHSSESANRDDTHGNLHGACGPVDSGSKIALQCKDGEELPKSDGGVDKEAKDDSGNQHKEQEMQREESHIQHCKDNNETLTRESKDLTEIRSSLISKSSNTEPVLGSVEKNISETGHVPLDSVKDISMSVSSGIPASIDIPSSNYLDNAFPDHSFSSHRALDSAYVANQKKSVEFLVAIDRTSEEQRSSGLPELRMCSSVPKDRGEKRALEEDCMTDETKKAKQWLSVAQSNDYPQLSELLDKKPIAAQKRDSTTFSESSNPACLPTVSLLQKGSVEPGISQGEEKQLFSNSYKTCDLNLMEASDMNENHGAAALLYPPVSALKKEAHIGIDLSMSNNFSFNNGYNDGRSLGKDVEIIDLDDSSLEEGKNLNTSTRNAEAGIASMESFANNPQNPSDNPDGQDGYGFMISELLGNDVPNCSSVQPDMNTMQNDMGLHQGEGIFNEDDPIYMSLGEIPLTGLLRGWEQPTQERNPFEL